MTSDIDFGTCPAVEYDAGGLFSGWVLHGTKIALDYALSELEVSPVEASDGQLPVECLRVIAEFVKRHTGVDLPVINRRPVPRIDEYREVDQLEPSDFERWPVWEFNLADSEMSDTAMFPIKHRPVLSLGNRIVATRMLLANGARLWASLGGIDLNDPIRTREVVGACVHIGGDNYYVDRLHEGSQGGGLSALPERMRLPKRDVFPVRYDLSDTCVGHPEVLRSIVDIA